MFCPGSNSLNSSAVQREPRIRIILSLRGIERMEIWGRTDSDQQQAMALFFKLARKLGEVNKACRD
jgi:hypothetical protein